MIGFLVKTAEQLPGNSITLFLNLKEVAMNHTILWPFVVAPRKERAAMKKRTIRIVNITSDLKLNIGKSTKRGAESQGNEPGTEK